MRNATRAPLDPDELREVADTLLADLAQAQKRLGLTDVEIAARAGINRMTVQRAKQEAGDPRLSSFVGMAAAVGLKTTLLESDQSVTDMAASSIVHRGLACHRLLRDTTARDTQREAAFANLWEVVNEHAEVGLSPMLPNLVPHHTQAQATAAATVIQWLGSEVGFDFLNNALRTAGYNIVDNRKK